MVIEHGQGNMDPRPKRSTLKHFFHFLFEFDIKEIGRVIRRRFLNSTKYASRLLRKIFGLVFDIPPVKNILQQRKLRKILKKYYDYAYPKNTDKQIKVAFIARDLTTMPKSSAFIRIISPLTQSVTSKHLSLLLFNQDISSFSEQIDICIVQRTAFNSTTQVKKLCKYLKDIDIPLIVDTDDAFDQISEEHSEYKLQSARVEAKKELLKNADEIWVSTKKLAESLNHLSNIHVIPNSLDRRIWHHKDTSAKGVNQKLRLVYMGTVTHDADLKLILPALNNVDKLFPDSFELTLIGVTDNIPAYEWVNKVYLKSSVYPLFVEWFTKEKRFDIGLSPLVDNNFNASKSDIKCLDYIAAGILPIVSDVEAYKSEDLDDLVVRVKNNQEDWEKVLSNLVADPVATRKIIQSKVRSGQEYIRESRSSEQTAEIILKRVRILLNKK